MILFDCLQISGRIRGNNATSAEKKKPRKEYETTIAEEKEQSNMITRKRPTISLFCNRFFLAAFLQA